MGLSNQPIPSMGVGTGVILDTDGNIMTNNHVVAGAQRITVSLFDGEGFVAEVVGTDFQTDLAIIRIDPGDYELRPAKLGNSSQLQVGGRRYCHRSRSWTARRPYRQQGRDKRPGAHD